MAELDPPTVLEGEELFDAGLSAWRAKNDVSDKKDGNGDYDHDSKCASATEAREWQCFFAYLQDLLGGGKLTTPMLAPTTQIAAVDEAVLTNADHGKTVIASGTSAIDIACPASPTAGTRYTFVVCATGGSLSISGNGKNIRLATASDAYLVLTDGSTAIVEYDGVAGAWVVLAYTGSVALGS
jgi:hypothetical protein